MRDRIRRELPVGDLRTVPTAPGALPGVGHAWQMMRRPLAFLVSLRDVGPLVRVRLGAWSVYLVTDPSLTYELLTEHARNVTQGRLFERIRPLVGNGIATSDGSFHRRQRRAMQPAFNSEPVRAHEGRICERVQALADSWRPGDTIAVDTAMNDLTFDIAVETLLAAEPDSDAAAEVREALPVIFKIAPLMAMLPSALSAVPFPPVLQFTRATTRLRAALSSLIDQRRANPVPGSVLSLLLAARDPYSAEPMSETQVRDELITILIAGTQTTATNLSWVFHELGQRPDVDRFVYRESKSAATMHDPPYPYTRNVIREALRLHADLMLMRRVASPIRLGDVTIPAGTELAYSLYALHRDPRLFADPDRFDPDRWQSEAVRDLPRSAFMPFGAGPRKCIGEAFAWAEMIATVTTITARWRLGPAPGHTVRQVATQVPRPDALPMIPIARKDVD